MNPDDQARKNIRLALILLAMAIFFGISSVPFWDGIQVIK